MAIAFDSTSRSIGAQVGTSKTLSHTCTGTNLVLFVGVTIYNNGSNADTLTGITYAGVSMTLIAKQDGSSGPQMNYLYYLINPSTGANNIVATTTGTVAELDVVGASYTGAKQSGVPDAFSSGTGTSPRTLTVTTIANNCWLVGVFASDQGSTVSAGTNTTKRNTGGLMDILDSNSARSTGSNSIQGTVPSGNIAGVMCSFAPYIALGPANLKSYNTNLKANIKSINTNLIANVKSLNTNV